MLTLAQGEIIVPIGGTQDLETLEDCIRWIYYHDGVIETRWDRQFKDNQELLDIVKNNAAEVARSGARSFQNRDIGERHEGAITKLFKRVGDVERTAARIAGASAAGGALIGTILGGLAMKFFAS